ncbi:hypothetical protein QYH69_18790 [Paraburkholderia sp. SARCC-3016]|uniref:hypothetical protein n=1 Tax=Paraburkholderia sp. SARCC-3016 TaxID=3058611 RepID=UPI002807936B|nr:hypothetical protein [Paraburkholderia sp. SARCC-3016]MDQ7979299.1 hypothetical protein [Paraburkholderia sp. SARCC-3016]
MANDTNAQTIAQGSFDTQRDHAVRGGILEGAIASYESVATTFAVDMISDHSVRQQYIAHIKEISEQVRREVASGNMTVKEGAEYCSQLRDKLFVEYRRYTSALGVAIAEKLKLRTRGFDFYLNKYAQSQFRRDFIDLTAEQRHAVYFKVLSKAGDGNTDVTATVRRLQIIAKAAILGTVVLAINKILNAKDKIREAARQGSIIAGGMLGGAAAGMTVSFICGPAEPVCALALVLIGSNLGGIAAEGFNDVYQDELDAFRCWLSQ